jgi:membrane protein DedA with SNARE-associated domain
VGSAARALIVIYLYEAACAIFLPLPSEAPMFLFPELSRMTVLAACGLGKGCGAYLVFRSGDRIRQSRLFRRALRALSLEAVWMRLTDWAARVMRTYGFAGFLLVQSMPGMPMRSAVYSASLLGVTPAKFALGAAVGTIVRNLVVYGGYLGIVGLGQLGS